MREKMVEMERQMTEFATVVQQELSRVSRCTARKNRRGMRLFRRARVSFR